MEQLQDIDEFAICSDITSRTALFALARVCTEEETAIFYEALREILAPVYDPAKLMPLIDTFKNAALQIKAQDIEI